MLAGWRRRWWIDADSDVYADEYYAGSCDGDPGAVGSVLLHYNLVCIFLSQRFRLSIVQLNTPELLTSKSSQSFVPLVSPSFPPQNFNSLSLTGTITPSTSPTTSITAQPTPSPNTSQPPPSSLFPRPTRPPPILPSLNFPRHSHSPLPRRLLRLHP